MWQPINLNDVGLLKPITEPCPECSHGVEFTGTGPVKSLTASCGACGATLKLFKADWGARIEVVGAPDPARLAAAKMKKKPTSP